jgi:hypothetical protein
MPTPVNTTLLVFAAILTVLSPLAAVIVAGVAVLFEVGVFLLVGSGTTDVG